MFRKWINENNLENFDFSGKIFPPAKDREFWENKYDESYIKNAEQYIGFNWPVCLATDFMAFKNEGNRLQQEKPYFKRRSALVALLKAELVEHKGRFMPDIVNGIFAICEETFWGVSAHINHGLGASAIDKQYCNIPIPQSDYIDLFASDTGAILAVIYDILYDEFDEFCPEILSYMEYELDRRIVEPYLKHTDWWWMGYDRDKVNNWNPWILANILNVFLVREMSHKKRCKGIEKLLFEVNKIYETLPDDGGCDEGSNYWGVSGGMLFEFVEQLYLATNGKINFYTDEKLKNIFLFDYYSYIGNGNCFNFADCLMHVRGISSLLYMIGERIGNEKVKSVASDMIKIDLNEPLKEEKGRRTLWKMIYSKTIPFDLPLKQDSHILFNDLQVSIERNDKWYYAFKGGNNDEGHNHNDVGSFIACFNNKCVLCDPGCGEYTRQTFGVERYTIWTMRSDWHNLPLINNVKQKQGPQYEASAFEYKNGESVASFEKAYPEEAGLYKLERKMKLSDDGIDVFDFFEFKNNENIIREHFITTHDVKIKNNQFILGNEFIIESDSAAELLIETVEFKNDEKLIKAWNTDRMNRVVFEYKAPKTKNIKITLRRM